MIGGPRATWLSRSLRNEIRLGPKTRPAERDRSTTLIRCNDPRITRLSVARLLTSRCIQKRQRPSCDSYIIVVSTSPRLFFKSRGPGSAGLEGGPGRSNFFARLGPRSKPLPINTLERFVIRAGQSLRSAHAAGGVRFSGSVG